MPRVLQPGGGGGKMRVRYTARRKRGLVATSQRMIAEGMTLRAAAEELRVSVANLSKWALQGMGEVDRLDKILRSKKKAALTGPSSQLKAIEDGLLRYIFEQREQGVEVSTFTVVLRVSRLPPHVRAQRCMLPKSLPSRPRTPHTSRRHCRCRRQTWCADVFEVVSKSCAGYVLFHVNKVHRCAYLYAHRRNDGILGITGKLLMRRDNLSHLIKGIV
jgi:hypothetical protein